MDAASPRFWLSADPCEGPCGSTCERLNPLLNDDGQAATFAEWYLDWLTHEEPLTTPKRRQAALRRWDAGVETPICLRWFNS